MKPFILFFSEQFCKWGYLNALLCRSKDTSYLLLLMQCLL